MRQRAPDGPITFIEAPAGDGVLVYPGEAFGETGPLTSSAWNAGAMALGPGDWGAEHRFGRDEAQASCTASAGPPAYTSDPQAIEDWRRAMAERLMVSP